MKEYQDWFFKKAKKEGVLSRAYYKLEAMDKKHRLFRAGSRVLDLGCSPGSWLQYAAKHMGASGYVLGVDKVPPSGALPKQVHCVTGDIFTLDPASLTDAAGGPFDVVLSDAAPNTTGERFVDQQNSLRLATRALEIAQAVVVPGGHLVLKVFQGPDIKELQESFKRAFETLHVEKPQSSRKESFEVYFVGLRLRVISSRAV